METSDVSNKYYVYILFSLRDQGFYIGYTENLKNRLLMRSSGKVPSTKLRRSLKLIHFEYFINIKDAKSREKFLKSGYGRDQLKQFMKNTLRLLNIS